MSSMVLFIAVLLVPRVQNGFLHFSFPQLNILACVPYFKAGLPACVLKEQVLNIPLWEGYGAKINSEALHLASGGCQRWYLLSLEALIYAACGKLFFGVPVLRRLEDHCLPVQSHSWRPLRGLVSPATG